MQRFICIYQFEGIDVWPLLQIVPLDFDCYLRPYRSSIIIVETLPVLDRRRDVTSKTKPIREMTPTLSLSFYIHTHSLLHTHTHTHARAHTHTHTQTQQKQYCVSTLVSTLLVVQQYFFSGKILIIMFVFYLIVLSLNKRM